MSTSNTNAPRGSAGREWRTCRLYGLTLASDFPFANRLPRFHGTPDVTFTCSEAPPCVSKWDEQTPAFASPVTLESGESLVYLYRHRGFDVLRYAEVADFFLWPDRVVCHLQDPKYDYVVEVYLLGLVLSFWLERRGTPVLHASAVSVDGRAVVFLATNYGGKTSLAATLMQAGHPLLSDDVLAVETRGSGVVVQPGYPQMRMWPKQAEYFLGRYETLAQVHPALEKRRVPVGPNGVGAFQQTSEPLGCIYLSEMRSANGSNREVRIDPVSKGDAAIELVRGSFLPNIVVAAGLQARRMSLLSQIANQIPVRRLSFPEDPDQLPKVRQHILRDLQSV